MIYLAIICMLIGIILFGVLIMFCKELSYRKAGIISFGIALLLAVAAMSWVYYFAGEMPPDAEIIKPMPK